MCIYSQGSFSEVGATWQHIWTYRRLMTNSSSSSDAAVGDVTLQNWAHGNDNTFNYVFMSRANASQQRADWQGEAQCL